MDGVLVEKPAGYRESLLTACIGGALSGFATTHRLGLVTGPDGMMRLFPRRVRIPDVAFVSWTRIPGGRVPDRPIPDLAPDLAVEVLSESNTRAEMEQKRREYFRVGTQRVWEVDLETRTVDVYTSPDSSTRLTPADVLEGEPALPGFRLPVAELFAVLDQQAPGTPPAP